MDYETPDGSQFSLGEVWNERNGELVFDYTTISAYVDGVPYVGKLNQYPEEVDDADVLGSLEPVPVECIHPLFPDNLTIAPEFQPSKHYLKAPSFTYDDCQDGKTFVADCVLNEASVLERLKQDEHPNIVSYYGSVMKDGRITHLCLERYTMSLAGYINGGLSDSQTAKVLEDIQAAIEHLHLLGLAHNDVNIDNICVDANGNAVLLDFDSCLPFGKNLIKGVGRFSSSDSEIPLSCKENDFRGLEAIEDYLWRREVCDLPERG